jgi:Na+/melibiose symporter-like transporter
MDTPSHTADPAALAEIQGTKPWLRFLSILGFIGAGVCLLAAVFMAGLGIAGKEKPILMAAMAFVYVLIAAIYLFASLRLHWAANAAGEVLADPTPAKLTAFLAQNRQFWKLIGIISIAFMALYFLAIIAAIALPIAQKLRNS